MTLLIGVLLATATTARGEAEQHRRAALFIFDSGNEHDTLLDAQLTLELYRQKDRVSYWVSDQADGSAKETLAAYELVPQELPVVLLLDRDDAKGQPVMKIPVRRPLGYEKNLEAINQALETKFGLKLTKEPPKVEEPKPQPEKPKEPAEDRQERRELAKKATALGSMYRQAGNAARAEAYYLWAMRFDPECASAVQELARLYLDRRRYPQAVSLFARAEKLDPAYPSPVLLYDNFDDGRLDGWLIQRGQARVAGGRLELASTVADPAIVGAQGDRPWYSYRLLFSYRDANAVAFGRSAPSFSCAVRSTRTGAYWFRTTGFGAEVFKTVLDYGRYTPRQLMLANLPWNDADWHERAVEVTSLPNGAARMRWTQDGRLVGECADQQMPYGEGAISFHTESAGAQIDDVLVLQL